MGQAIGRKVIFLSERSVGKSSIIDRMVFNSFRDRLNVSNGLHEPGITIDIVPNVLQLENHQIKLLFADTVDMHRHRDFIWRWASDCHAIIMVYDITNADSFSNLIQQDISGLMMDNKQPALFLIGNKLDLNHRRQVSVEMAADIASKLHAYFIEVSAKTGENTAQLLKAIIMGTVSCCSLQTPLLENANNRPQQPFS